MSNIKYRPDVDGLRAVSVFLVILFHMNADWIPGGFIGVDMFFVISGFIITSAIYPQISTNDFSFNLFYVKRIKRILPLFYLVVCTCLIFSYWLHTPNDFASFADSWRYASSFIANIYFEKHSGYFAPTSETLPLLHTWSLSIEEQFYFVWPVVLIISARYLSKSSLATFIILSLVGLVGYSQYLTVTVPETGYYFIQSRAFELLIGGLLAILSANKPLKDLLPWYFFNLFGITGLVAVISLAWILNESDSFPGINALWVVASACLIILSGENQRSIVSRILSTRPIVFMGRLSYSLYLWHWPVLAFYRYYYIDFTVMDAAVCGLVTLVLSVVSWRFFETRLRHVPMKKRWVYLFYLILPIAISVIVAKNIAHHDGYPQRFPKTALELYSQSTSSFDDQKPFLQQVEGYFPFEPYVIGNSSAPISTFIWGDSHAGHYRSFIDEMGKQENFASLFGGIGGCPPLLGVDLLKYGEPEIGCTKLNDELVRVIERRKPKLVFIAARWAMYTETTRSPGEKGSRVFLGDASDYSESVANSRRALELGLRNTIKRLLESNVTPVILEQVPDYSFKPSNCWFKKELYSWMQDVPCDIDRKSVAKRFAFVNQLFATLKSDFPEVQFISVMDVLCDERLCRSKVNDVPLYEDNNHLNADGARALEAIWFSKANGK